MPSLMSAGSYDPPGADAPGFVTFTQQGVNVSPGQANPLDIALRDCRGKLPRFP